MQCWRTGTDLFETPSSQFIGPPGVVVSQVPAQFAWVDLSGLKVESQQVQIIDIDFWGI